LPGFLIDHQNSIIFHNDPLLAYFPKHEENNELSINDLCTILRKEVKQDFFEGIELLKKEAKHLVFPSGLIDKRTVSDNLRLELFSADLNQNTNIILGFLVPEHPNDKEFEIRTILEQPNILNLITNLTDTIFLNIRENGDIIQSYNSRDVGQRTTSSLSCIKP